MFVCFLLLRCADSCLVLTFCTALEGPLFLLPLGRPLGRLGTGSPVSSWEWEEVNLGHEDRKQCHGPLSISKLNGIYLEETRSTLSITVFFFNYKTRNTLLKITANVSEHFLFVKRSWILFIVKVINYYTCGYSAVWMIGDLTSVHTSSKNHIRTSCFKVIAKIA